MTGRQFVPFESLWKMAIDVPYSFLVRDGDQAWSCGQLALDPNSNVIAPGDLPAQSRIVADYVSQIIQAAGLDKAYVVRLVLFVDVGRLSDVDAMRAAFHSELSPHVILDVVPVPHFYYDGVVLEVDVFCGGEGVVSRSGGVVSIRRDRQMVWVSINTSASEIETAGDLLDSELASAGINRSHLLSAHWSAPSDDLAVVSQAAEASGLLPDAGAATATGVPGFGVNGRFVFTTSVVTAEPAAIQNENVTIAANQSEWFGWVQARSTDPTADLVGQTRQIMAAIDSRLADHGVGFDAVVKSTALYTGGSSAEELHDNMSVRNAFYRRPGPASTGLPVFGLADERSRIVVDVTYAK